MKKNKNKNLSWREKKVNRIPSNISGFLFTLTFMFFAILQIVTEWSCMDTLLPICIPWMYYQHVVLGTFLLPFIITPIRKRLRKSTSKREPITDNYTLMISMILIIIPSIVFLPNRYIPIGAETKTYGIVISQTSAAVNKSPSANRNYVKIRIDEENTSFWYCIYKKAKPVGSKCIVSVRRGIYGMKYVEKVDFIVE